MKSIFYKEVERSLKPLLIKSELSLKILRGEKTVTRRRSGLDFINQSPRKWHISNDITGYFFAKNIDTGKVIKLACNIGEIGDIIWFREKFCPLPDGTFLYDDFPCESREKTWKPSLFMPLEVCRCFAIITDIRLERICEISNEDAIAEGVEKDGDDWKNYMSGPILKYPSTSFFSLLKKINGEFDPMSFVWVIRFEKIENTSININK